MLFDFLRLKTRIGIVMTPGCRAADVVGIDSVLNLHPLHQVLYVGRVSGEIVETTPNFGFVANASLDDCPALDVLAIGESREPPGPDLWAFLKRQAETAKFIIGVSNGVWTLHQAGVLEEGSTITCDEATLAKLEKDPNSTFNIVNERRCVRDGKLVTAGPSTGMIEAAFSVLKELRGEWYTRFTAVNMEYHAEVQYPVKDATAKLVPPPAPQLSLNIGVFVPPDVFLPDVIGAADVFSSVPNTQFHFLSPQAGTSNSILGYGPTTLAKTATEKCPSLDVLVLGACHPRYIRETSVLDFILKQEPSIKAMISVCAGTFVVGSSGLLAGKRAATNCHQVPDLGRVGATPSEELVATDGKYCSAGPAVGSYQVGLKALELTLGKEWAQYVEHTVLEFAPNPLYPADLESQHWSIRFLTQTMSVLMRAIFRPFIAQGYFGKGLLPKITS